MNHFRVWTILLLSTLIIGVFSRALLHNEFFLMHDYTHPARIAEMLRSLQAGQFPPTWSQNLGFGYGMPLFMFYGPLPYFVGSIITALGLTPLQSTQFLFILSNILAFAGAYNLNKRWGRTSGLLAATLLLAAPYRAVDIYVRGALNETIAISFLPWIIHFCLSIREKETNTPVAGLALAVAALILTHNLTALFSLPLIGIFIAVVYLGTRTPLKTWGRLLLGGFWGVCLSLFYAIPAFLEKGSTAIDSILGGYFDYHLHFLYIRQWLLPRWGYGGSEFGPNDGISFHLGWTALILVVITLGITAAKIVFHRKSFLDKTLDWLRLWHKHLPLRFWITLGGSISLALSLFLTLNHSAFVWESVPLMNFIQFPWRILGVSIVFLSLLGGLSVSHIRWSFLRWPATGVLLLFVLSQLPFHQPEKFLPANDGHFTTDPVEIRGNMSSVLPDYIAKGFNQKLPPVWEEKRIVTTPTQELTWEINDPHQLLAYPKNPELQAVTWNIAHFPGWQYFVNEKEVQPELNKDGVMTYSTQEPVSSVAARFSLTPLRKFALIFSVIALLPFSVLIPKNRKLYGQS